MRLSGLSWICAALAAAFFSAVGFDSAFAQVTMPAIPSVRIMKGALVAPNPALYSATPTFTNSLCAPTSTTPAVPQLCTGKRAPEIKELARSLKNNPDLIYEYIHNAVDTEFQFGLQKGAMGVIIDGSGTAFDQASLMAELLRESGYSATKIVYGTLTLTSAAFYNWTGISDATAACNFLATGGIPAAFNVTVGTGGSVSGGSSPSDCTGLSSFTNVEVQHVWVQTTINGSILLFDPSYKSFAHKSGINPASFMNFIPGGVLAQATPGAASTWSGVTSSGVSYVTNFNQTAAATALQGYAASLLTRLRRSDMQGADLTDVIGGHIITPLGARPAAGWGLGNLNPADGGAFYNTTATWGPPTADNLTGIPDIFRTTLEVVPTVQGAVGADGSTPLPDFDKTFFVDEIYGRRFTIWTNQIATSSSDYPGAASRPRNQYHPIYMLDGVTFFTSTVCPPLYVGMSTCSTTGTILNLALTARHPFAAAAAAGTSNCASNIYGCEIVSKTIQTLYPAAIVHGWGHTSESLSAKWQGEVGVDSPMLQTYVTQGGDSPPMTYPAPAGDLQRATIGATWLAQFSQAADIHAELANARLQHLHSIGVVSIVNNTYDPTPPTVSPASPPPRQSGFQASDQTAILDVETAFGLTVRASDAASTNKRRPAIHAIAATAAALEGSVFEQLTDTPDAPTTARRFAWGNAPEALETPDVASRRVYEFTSGNSSQAANLILAENSVTGYTATFQHDQLPLATILGSSPLSTRYGSISKGNAVTAITNYTAAQFDVLASNEAMLGPGYRNGTVWSKPSTTSSSTFSPGNQYFVTDPTQVGGALIANLYDSAGNPLQIAHVVMTPWGVSKGGGGNQTDQTQFNASSLQNSLRDRFVDRSTKLAVDLKAGKASFSSPVLESVGQGEFPYKLERKVELRGSGLKRVQPGDGGNYDVPQFGVVTNWQSSADPSNSASEAMGQSRVEASAETLAAFVSMQDIWASGPSPKRELIGELVADWWGRKLLFNVVTVSLGAKSEAFVKLADGTFIPTQGGGDTVSVTGDRTAVRLTNYAPPINGWSATRQWRYNGVGFVWTGINGDTRTYKYWEGGLTVANLDAKSQDSSYGPATYWDSALAQPQKNTGFGLTTWQFPFGVYLTLPAGGTPTSVTSSLGRTLNLPSPGDPSCGSGSYTLPVANLANETTKVGFLPYQTGTGLLRPVGSCEISSIYEPINGSSPSIQYTYDTIGRVMQAQDAVSVQLGTAVRLPYTYFIAPGYRGEWDDPLGGQYAVETMQGGRYSRTIDEIGRVTSAVLDGRHRVVSRTFPEGDQEVFTYNAFDQVLSLTKVVKPGSSLSNTVVSATYDPVWNKLATLTDELGFVTNLSYYAKGNSGASLLYQVKRPAVAGVNPTYSYVYNSIGLPTSEVDPTSVTTAHGYDSLGNLTSTTIGAAAVGANPALNLTTNFTPDAIGNVVTALDPRGYASTTQFDAMRRKTDTQAHNGGATATPLTRSHWDYDLNGRLTDEKQASALDASGNATAWVATDYFYTPTGQKAQVTDPLGNVVQMSYDGDDRLLCSTVRMNPAVFGALPDACTLSTASSPSTPDRITLLAYDAAGQKLSETRAFGIVQGAALPGTTWTVPATLQQTYATYAYNPNGTVQKVWDANNNLTTYLYDGLDRLSQTSFPSKARYASQSAAVSDAADVESYSYDARGNRVVLVKRDGINQIDRCYDALNRESNKYLHGISSCATPPAPTGLDVVTTYDLAGRKLSALYASGQGVSYSYDAAGRLISEATNGLTLAYQYDASSNRSVVTWPDSFYTGYFYDGLNRLISINENSTAVGTGAIATYSYDPLSRRLGASLSNGVTTGYGYDAASHITSISHALPNGFGVTFGTITYNPAHQILSRPISNPAFDFTGYAKGPAWNSTANGLNQDATIAAITGGYDGNGNETNDGTRAFTYDVENRLTSVSIPSASTNVTLAYDPTGRLQQQVATISSGVTTTQFLYSGDRLVAEYVGGMVANRYVHGSGTDEPVVWYPGSTTTARNWLHADNQGSVIAYSNGSGGVGTYQYGAYGEPSAWSGGRFRYTGQIMLPEVKLYYFKARVYDPIAGRFLQTDPIGYKDDLDLYEYVGDDPIDRADPSGKAGIEISVEGWAVVGHHASYDSEAIGVSISKDGTIQVGRVGATSNIGTGLGAGGTVGPGVFRGTLENTANTNTTVVAGRGALSTSVSYTEKGGKAQIPVAAAIPAGKASLGAAVGGAKFDTSKTQTNVLSVNPVKAVAEAIINFVKPALPHT